MYLFFFKFFSHLGCYRILSRVPCAFNKDLLYSTGQFCVWLISVDSAEKQNQYMHTHTHIFIFIYTQTDGERERFIMRNWLTQSGRLRSPMMDGSVSGDLGKPEVWFSPSLKVWCPGGLMVLTPSLRTREDEMRGPSSVRQENKGEFVLPPLLFYSGPQWIAWGSPHWGHWFKC